MLGYLKK